MMNLIRKAVVRWLLGADVETLIERMNRDIECYNICVKLSELNKRILEDYESLSELHIKILDAAGKTDDLEAFRLKVIGILIEENRKRIARDHE